MSVHLDIARPRPTLLRVLAPLLLVAVSGCASDYVARTRSARTAYERSDFKAALASLDDAEKDAPENDRLLLLLDRGMYQHAAGDWEGSIKTLGEADRLAAQLDVVSVSEEAAIALSNERHRHYRGEDFERLMIAVLQAINYAKLGKDEDALVEVRRVNERLQVMIAEGRPYQQLAVARYLGGALWEDQGELDSAIIDYQKAFELEPNLGALAEPLLRLAKKTGRDDLYQRLKQTFPTLSDEPLGPDEGEVLVIIEAGKAPEKESERKRSPGQMELVVVPVFRDRWGGGPSVVEHGDQRQVAVRVTDLERVAKIHLDDRIGRMIAQQVAGNVVKAGIALGAAALTRSDEVGLLTFFLLSLGNDADLRSWLSLPAEFQMARFRLPKGKQKLRVSSGGRTTEHEVEVRAGRVDFVVLRSF